MGKTLFIGCSHTMGYSSLADQSANVWQENNYAELYSRLNNKEVIVMASAGAGNRAFPRFLAHAFKQHSDIDEVYIQSTYWGRFPVVINPDLNEKNIFPLDFFIEKEPKIDKVERYSISLSVDNKYLEHYIKPHPDDWDRFPYIKDTIPWVAEPDARRSSHMYFRMWHHSNTHLEQEDFFTNIAMCDMLCTYNNVPLYVWNINSRCYLPKETKDFYTELKSAKIANVDAETFLKNKNITVDTIDGEHYTTEVHKNIAHNYIPYIKETAC